MTEEQDAEVLTLLGQIRDLLAFLVELEAGPDPDEDDLTHVETQGRA